ncbi:MAG TPA: LuxR C-terminal-related transcriptional regulator [Herpetosiphonaceae bacterium]|nr:LuxR C-terminal-related transcriptional regulator [Herpetosiphonaceae bacterium]
MHRGEAIFSPAIARRMIQFFNAPRPTAPPQLFPELTDPEREVLTLIAQGLSNETIAARLVLSP